MFLRRRGDLASVMAELGGNLFATRGSVDNYFDVRKPQTEAEWQMFINALGAADSARGVMQIMSESYQADERVKKSVSDHIRSAPEREAAQLRKWAIGYDDGLRTALAVLNREDER